MKLKTGTTLIFSYGSNSINQLRGRLGSPGLSAVPAYINDWSRIFCHRVERWGNGGVASLAPHEGARTLGSLVQLDERELTLLDEFERGYTRREVEVILSQTSAVHLSHVYLAIDPTWQSPPSEEYLTAIHVMLREQHKTIERIPVNKLRTDGFVETIYDWHHPGHASLGLPSLIVEVNARRQSPWTMPHAIGDIVNTLCALNIRTTEELLQFLRTDECKSMSTQKKLESSVYLDDEAISIFKSLLGAASACASTIRCS